MRDCASHGMDGSQKDPASLAMSAQEHRTANAVEAFCGCTGHGWTSKIFFPSRCVWMSLENVLMHAISCDYRSQRGMGGDSGGSYSKNEFVCVGGRSEMAPRRALG
jgi:hypothetical protein